MFAVESKAINDADTGSDNDSNRVTPCNPQVDRRMKFVNLIRHCRLQPTINAGSVVMMFPDPDAAHFISDDYFIDGRLFSCV